MVAETEKKIFENVYVLIEKYMKHINISNEEKFWHSLVKDSRGISQYYNNDLCNDLLNVAFKYIEKQYNKIYNPDNPSDKI